MDLHYWVRKLGSEKGELPAVEGLPGAVAAARQVGGSLPSLGSWGILDGYFTDSTSGADLARVAAQAPESLATHDGKTLPLRQDLMQLAASYRGVEKAFLAGVWPAHREVAERAAASVRSKLLPRSAEVYADVSKRLGLPAPAAPIPVYLVAAAPFPGAFTMYNPDGPYSVVALEGEPDSLWVEIVLHESIHALDTRTREGSVLADLRRRLAAVPGLSPKEAADAVHALMFVQAAATVRAVLDPAHRDYGDVRGVYGRMGRAAEAVVPAWREHLAGTITREAALDRIVAKLSPAPATEKEKGGPKAAPTPNG